MADYGLIHAKYCKITETTVNGVTTESLGAGGSIGGIISSKAAIKYAEAKLFADNGLKRYVKEFVSGTLTVDVEDLSDDAIVAILDATDTNGVITYSDSDDQPYVRFGTIRCKYGDAGAYYRVVCYMKVKFSQPSEDYKTKGESINFTYPQLSGEIMKNSAGDWKTEQDFTTLAAAETYLDTLVNIAA